MSVRPDGTQVDGRSIGWAISGNGRFVLFESLASDLVPGDTNGASDIFVKDLRSGRVELVSRTPSGGQLTGQAPLTKSGISVDGTRVVFDVSMGRGHERRRDPGLMATAGHVYFRQF